MSCSGTPIIPGEVLLFKEHTEPVPENVRPRRFRMPNTAFEIPLEMRLAAYFAPAVLGAIALDELSPIRGAASLAVSMGATLPTVDVLLSRMERRGFIAPVNTSENS